MRKYDYCRCEYLSSLYHVNETVLTAIILVWQTIDLGWRKVGTNYNFNTTCIQWHLHMLWLTLTYPLLKIERFKEWLTSLQLIWDFRCNVRYKLQLKYQLLGHLRRLWLVHYEDRKVQGMGDKSVLILDYVVLTTNYLGLPVRAYVHTLMYPCYWKVQNNGIIQLSETYDAPYTGTRRIRNLHWVITSFPRIWMYKRTYFLYWWTKHFCQ